MKPSVKAPFKHHPLVKKLLLVSSPAHAEFNSEAEMIEMIRSIGGHYGSPVKGQGDRLFSGLYWPLKNPSARARAAKMTHSLYKVSTWVGCRKGADGKAETFYRLQFKIPSSYREIEELAGELQIVPIK